MKTSLKYIAIPLFGIALLPFAVRTQAVAQNTQSAAPGATAPTPATPDTSVPAVVAPPTSPNLPSGKEAGTSSEAAKMGSLDAKDAEFVNQAAMGGLAEVAAGKLAEHSDESQIKQFGQRMVEDHSKVNQELAVIAQNKGVKLPTTVDAEARTKIEKLNGIHGRDFDRTYIADMVADHVKDIAMFQKVADEGVDPQVKQFAQQALPTLKEHLSMAQGISQKIASK